MNDPLFDAIAHSNEKFLKERKEYNLFNSIYVYVKDPLPDGIDVTSVLQQVEDALPSYLSSGVESIFVGEFEELESREVSAVFDGGTVYLTNKQASDRDMFDDIVHEIAHSVETWAGLEIYGDGALEQEYLKKSKILLDILAKEGYNVTTIKALFYDVEYSREFDFFLYKTVGYDILNMLTMNVFPTPYSVTSLREYFAVGFEEYFIGDKSYLEEVSPVLYNKIDKIAGQ